MTDVHVIGGLTSLWGGFLPSGFAQERTSRLTHASSSTGVRPPELWRTEPSVRSVRHTGEREVSVVVPRMLLTFVVVAALAGCASGAQVTSLSEPSADPTTSMLTGSPTAAAPSATTSSATAQPSALTCGTVPASDGKLKTALTVKIDGPTVAPSGGTFRAQVNITTTLPTVDLSSSNVVALLIAQGHMIVGRSFRPVGGAGFEPAITPSAPATLPASIALTGCAVPPIDATDADLTRRPLPPGAYTIYAVVDEYDGDSETDRTNLVSAPFPIQIATARTASSAGVSSPAPGGASSPVPVASSPQPIGDATAIRACQAYEHGRGAYALTVVAGFSTTVGAAYRYQSQISEATGGGTPPPAATRGPNYTSPAPTVLCVADGTIDGPGPGMYSREVGVLSGDGTFHALVLSDAKNVSLQRP
jgi:hypothetical protein